MKMMIVVSLILQMVACQDLYHVKTSSPEGDVEIIARKEYNIWDNGPNRTYYEINIYSDLIEYDF